MTESSLEQEGYQRALALLHACATPDGFVASPSKHDNYRRIWSRDGTIIALAALLSGDSELIKAARHAFETLAAHQGPHGEIPTNVDIASGHVSYGGTTGRVDSDLWFIIGCGEYWLATGENEFLERLLPTIEKVRFVLGAWEFNNCGLIYVPLTDDWVDEYVHNGYVLLLYLQAQRTLARMHAELHSFSDHALRDKISHLRHLIRANYWFNGDGHVPEDAYHEVLYEKGRTAAVARGGEVYWMPFFSPSGYGYRFDAVANVLASLFDVADDAQRAIVDEYIAREICSDQLPLVPVFHPVIEPVDEDWKDLQVMFSYNFKNQPYDYQNGGLWPMINGFYLVDLTRRNRRREAEKCLHAIHRANSMEMEGEDWGFAEFIHGKTLAASGNRHQGWSAAATVIGHHALAGESVFRITGDG